MNGKTPEELVDTYGQACLELATDPNGYTEKRIKRQADARAALLARVAPPLVWTKEKPTVPGWFYQRNPNHTSPIMWEVFWSEPDRGVFSPYSEDYEPFSDGCEWAGPIPQPQEEAP
jgi:hypothetical protein